MLKRPSNRPRADIIALAERAIRDNGGPELARVFYKFDCSHCGSREAVQQPNVLPDSAPCSVCGGVTTITGGGFALQARRNVNVPWDAPGLFVRKRYESDKGDA